MTIADNLNRIIQAKDAIKASIENKGVGVGDATIDAYADMINQIEQGDDVKIKLPDGICLEGSTWETFDMGRYDWSNVHSWKRMFASCRSLTTLYNIPTNIKVYGSMQGAFMDNFNRTSIGDLSGWDVSNVNNMKSAFEYCGYINSVDLSGWDTSKVTTMENMFAECRYLTEVKMGGNVSNVTNVTKMFWNIESTGTFYYNPQYDYSKIIEVLPPTWTAIPME